MRRTRRGCFTGREPKYIWYVYASQGGAMIGTVASDTMDYPINGEQGGYWYVMMKGEYVMYVWNQYHTSGQYTQRSSSNERVDKPSTRTFTIYQYWSGQFPILANCDFDPQTGNYTLHYGYNSQTVRNFSSYTGSFTGAWMIDAISGPTVYSGSNIVTSSYVSGVTVYTSVFTYTKTDYIGTVESYDQSAYPQDGVQGDYWYTYSHSYNYVFDNQ